MGFFNSKIVFVSGTEQNKDLFIMDYDGYNVRRITNHHSLILSPDCSPDGSKIVFNSDKVWNQDIYVLSLLPKIEEKRLIHTGRLAQTAVWSPDGRKIAYSSGDSDIFVAKCGWKRGCKSHQSPCDRRFPHMVSRWKTNRLCF
ncbi:MAG: hypothetical protein C4291_07760 [Candidatus Dadabacteria bacterium]